MILPHTSSPAKLAKGLLEHKVERKSRFLDDEGITFLLQLIACANVMPVTSHFTWKDKIEKENEQLMIIKVENPSSIIHR